MVVGKTDRIFFFALRPLAVIFQISQRTQIEILIVSRFV